jgi:hypothetical protein
MNDNIVRLDENQIHELFNNSLLILRDEVRNEMFYGEFTLLSQFSEFYECKFNTHKGDYYEFSYERRKLR